jgi:endonuclease-8
MPEGPSIVILKEAVQHFTGKKIVEVYGNTKIDKDRLLHKKVMAFKSWGKHFLICFSGFSVRIHFMLFGSYLIDEEKKSAVRLGLKFSNGFINFYACSVQFIEGKADDVYDWSADVMNDAWDERKALAKLKEKPKSLICDALLDQHIFAGVGNIIKNEVLYRVKVHPESLVGKIPAAKRKSIVKESRIYSFQFLEWKKQFVLKKHWLAHTKKTCMRCNLPLIKKYTGLNRRRSFFCTNCQTLYA